MKCGIHYQLFQKRCKKKTTKRRIYLTNMKFGSSVISKILQKMRKLKIA